MKKVPLLLALALSLIGCAKQDSTVLSDPDSEYELSYSDTDIVLSQKDALGYVDEEYMNMNTDIWVSKEIIPAGTTINCIFSKVQSPKYDSWLVFINLKPDAFWSHDCLFRFVSAIDGKVTDVIGELPPSSIEKMDIIKHYTSEITDIFPGNIPLESRNFSSQSITPDYSKWAVLICGGHNINSNYPAFWNECSRIYNILVYQYNYSESHILVILADGTDPGLDREMNNGTYTSTPIDLDGNGTTDIDYSLTKANISSAFNSIRDNASNGDDVFVYVLTHGDDEDRNIMLWNPTGSSSSSYRFTPTDMIGELNKIQNTNIDIVMGQCHSGAFVTPLHGYCRSITTACKADEVASAPNRDYSAFYYRWCNSIEGYTPGGTTINADTNQDGHVSFWEAYNYSSLNAPSNETPQYQECTTLAGYNYGLEGELFSLPTLSGPNNIDNNNYGTYYLSNSCPGTSAVNWQFSEFLTQSSATNSYAVVMPTNTNVIALGQTVTAILTLPDRTASLKKENITCWMSGHIFSNSLIVGAVSESGGRVTLENPYPGVSYYYWDSDVFTPEYQSLYFTDLTLNPGAHISDESYISVAFTDYFGNPVTIIRMLNQ